MSSNVDKCLEILKHCSLEEKNEVLEILKVLTHDNLKVVNDVGRAKSPERGTPENLSFEGFVSYHPSFLEDKSFLNDLRFELDSLDLYRPSSRKPKTLWLSKNDNTLTKYPQISKLLDLVNKHGDIKSGDLDCCNIICYSNDRKSLRLHSDSEPSISQTHPIATFSVGASRRVEFVPLGASHTRVVQRIDAESNSLYIMHPGCQSVLQHRVLPGNTADCDEHIRFSLSFRKYKPKPNSTSTNEDPCTSAVLTNPSTTKLTPATLLLGDSFLSRLDGAKLGKSKKVVLNMARGGNKIKDVELSIDNFRDNNNNRQYLVDQVFVSVGTNDIRYCRNGVSHLKGELFGLIRKIKQSFPRAKLFLQSLLPLPITYSNRRYIVRNVCDLNRLIFHVCFHERVHMVDVFNSFLVNGHRNPLLFPSSPYDIHPNARGTAALARFYIDRIHGRRFDPLSLN